MTDDADTTGTMCVKAAKKRKRKERKKQQTVKVNGKSMLLGRGEENLI